MAQKELKLLLTAKDEASKVLDKVSGSATGMSSKIGSAMKVVAAGAAAAAGAVAVATTALYKITTGAAAAGDRIDKMSQRLGMSRTAFQQWDFVLSQNGVSIDSLQMGMKSLAQRMNEAIDGSGKGAEQFNKLGISVTDSSGAVRKQEDVFLDTVRALQNMEEGVQKAALAQEMFGRNGQELLPMLNQSKGSVDELMQKFKELGLELDDNAIDAGVRFTDTMDQVKRSFKTLTAQIGVEVMPIFQRLLDWILAHMPQIRKVMDTVFGALSLVVRAFGQVVEGLMPIFGKAFQWIQEKLATLKKLWDEDWGGIRSTVESALKLIIAALDLAWSTITLIFKAIGVALVVLKTLWDENFMGIRTIVTTALSIIGTLFKTALDVITGLFKVFSGLFTGDWQKMWDGVKLIFSAIWEGIKGVLVAVWESIKEIITGSIQWIKDKWQELKDFVSKPFKAIFSTETTNTVTTKRVDQYVAASHPSFVKSANGNVLRGGFQAFANGGVVSSPTLGLIGEGRYNEAVVPLPDGRSIPVEMRGGGITIQVTGNTFLGSARDVAKEIGKALKSEIDTNLRYAF